MPSKMLTKLQASKFLITLRAGGAATFVVRDERSMRTIRAVSAVTRDNHPSERFHAIWTGCVAYCWIGERNPFVFDRALGTYTHEENVVESVDVMPARRHKRAMAKLGITTCYFTGEAL